MTCNQFVSTCIGWPNGEEQCLYKCEDCTGNIWDYLDFSWTWKDRDTDCLLYDETLQIHSSRVYWLAEVGSCGIVSSREAWKVWWGLSGTLKYCTLNSLFVCSCDCRLTICWVN